MWRWAEMQLWVKQSVCARSLRMAYKLELHCLLYWDQQFAEWAHSEAHCQHLQHRHSLIVQLFSGLSFLCFRPCSPEEQHDRLCFKCWDYSCECAKAVKSSTAEQTYFVGGLTRSGQDQPSCCPGKSLRQLSCSNQPVWANGRIKYYLHSSVFM